VGRDWAGFVSDRLRVALMIIMGTEKGKSRPCSTPVERWSGNARGHTSPRDGSVSPRSRRRRYHDRGGVLDIMGFMLAVMAFFLDRAARIRRLACSLVRTPIMALRSPGSRPMSLAYDV
jgi:hypothetical protein